MAGRSNHYTDFNLNRFRRWLDFKNESTSTVYYIDIYCTGNGRRYFEIKGLVTIEEEDGDLVSYVLVGCRSQ
jgi:hypothetical protein